MACILECVCYHTINFLITYWIGCGTPASNQVNSPVTLLCRGERVTWLVAYAFDKNVAASHSFLPSYMHIKHFNNQKIRALQLEKLNWIINIGIICVLEAGMRGGQCRFLPFNVSRMGVSGLACGSTTKVPRERHSRGCLFVLQWGHANNAIS